MSPKKKIIEKSKLDLIDIVFLVAPLLQGLLPIWSLALLALVCMRRYMV